MSTKLSIYPPNYLSIYPTLPWTASNIQDHFNGIQAIHLLLLSILPSFLPSTSQLTLLRRVKFLIIMLAGISHL